MIIHMILYLCKSILLHIVCYLAFFKNLRIFSAKFGNSKSAWAHVTDWMRYLNYGVRKNDKWCYEIFLSFLIIWCSTRFPGLSTRIFRILHKLGENNHLNSSCRSQSWSGLYISPSSTIIKLNTQPETTQISTRFYLLLVHLPHAKSKSDKRKKLSDLLFRR